MKKSFFILFVGLAFLSCKKDSTNTIKTINWKLVDEISLPVVDYYNMPWAPTIIETDTSKIFMYYQDDVVIAYDLNSKKLISKLELPDFVKAAYFKNTDSIFILLQDNFEYDSTLYLFDINGKIKKIYSLANDSTFSKIFNIENRDSALYITNIDYLFAKNDNFYFTISKLYFDYINDSSFNAFQWPLVGHFNIKTEKFYIDSIFGYPDFKQGELLSKNYLRENLAFIKDKLVIGFNHTPTVFVYSTENYKLEKKTFRSFLIDSIKHKKKDSLELEYSYGYFFFDKNLNLLYRYISRDFQTLSMLLIDTNFNIIGESILPETMRRLLITKDGYYSVNLKKTFDSEDKLVIDKYEIELTEIDKNKFIEKNKPEEIKDTIKENCSVIRKNDSQKIDTLQQYLSKKINKDTYAAMIVPVFYSCHNCVDALLTNYEINQKIFKEKDVYLFAIGENISGIKNKLQEYGISLNSHTVIIDSNISIYEEAFVEPTLEHLIIVKNNNIELAESYYPDNLDSLIINIFNFVEKNND